MTLVPDSVIPGLWLNPKWKEGDPGTFAVIVGVSKYEHLDGSDACYGLDQLSVSAQTAYNFFCWLRDHYRYSACPLARSFLLLSPTQEETALQPEIAANGVTPTFANCEKAIESWYEMMRQLGKEAAEQSRSIFFFSGHGLEIIEDQQILLPDVPVANAESTPSVDR